MKHWKRLLSAVPAWALCFSLAACGAASVAEETQTILIPDALTNGDTDEERASNAASLFGLDDPESCTEVLWTSAGWQRHG